jgi:hypothetical protein
VTTVEELADIGVRRPGLLIALGQALIGGTIALVTAGEWQAYPARGAPQAAKSLLSL